MKKERNLYICTYVYYKQIVNNSKKVVHRDIHTYDTIYKIQKVPWLYMKAE